VSIQSKIAVQWLGTFTNYVAEWAPTIDSTTWTAVTNPPVVIGGQTVILVDPAGGQQFFRLRLAR